MFKKLILTALVTLALATVASAASTPLNLSMEVKSPPIGIVKDSDLVFEVFKTVGKTAYTDADIEWNAVKATPASFTATGDMNADFGLTLPTTAVLTSGANSVTTGLVCRVSNTAYPVDKNDGAACGATATSNATTGKLFFRLFPVSATFDSENTGTYTGPINVSVN